MKIGIIIYSQTGHTYSVANKLMKKLSEVKHFIEVKRLNPIGEVNPGIKNIEFESIPDIKDYDVVIFGSPVWAFSLCPVFKIYLNKLSSLENKKIICFVTMAFPFTWMGGKRAISQMKKICMTKGSILQTTQVINWSNKRNEKIDKFINNTIQILD